MTLVLSVGKFGKCLTPPPLKNANVLNGWSLSKNDDEERCFLNSTNSINGCLGTRYLRITQDEEEFKTKLETLYANGADEVVFQALQVSWYSTKDGAGLIS